MFGCVVYHETNNIFVTDEESGSQISFESTNHDAATLPKIPSSKPPNPPQSPTSSRSSPSPMSIASGPEHPNGILQGLHQ